MLTPIETAWAAIFFLNDETEELLAALDEGLADAGYSRPDRAEAEQALADFRTGGYLVGDPTLRVLAGIWLNAHRDDVQKAAAVALGILIDTDTGGTLDDLTRAAVLASLALDVAAPSQGQSTARRICGDLQDFRRQFGPDEIAWVAAQMQAQQGGLEPDHILARDDIKPGLRRAVHEHEPVALFDDPVLMSLGRLALQFDQDDEPGAADVALSAAAKIARRALSGADAGFATGLAVELIIHRAAGRIAADAAQSLHDAALRLHRGQ
jgi:hypothetical protein